MTRLFSMKGLVLWGLFVTCGALHAVEYPPVIWVPVTFYDFHSDRSNPEFEQRHQGGLRTGMVASTLDSEGKPTLGEDPYMNYYIKYWFRSWEKVGQNDFTAPTYTPRAGHEQRYEDWTLEFQQDVIYDGIEMRDHDTSFKNIVISDSLPFSHVGDGVYEFRDDAFFPLDNRGFGNEWNHERDNEYASGDVDHNYSFTMELHWSFVKVPGMIFRFRGDDDVWGFIDGNLQMDLGGIHEAEDQAIYIDEIAGLRNGHSYSFDIFYAERHSAESHIWITTNMLFAPPAIYLYGKPDAPDSILNPPIAGHDTISAGMGYEVFAHVFDSSATWRPEYDREVTWQIIGPDGQVTATYTGPAATLPAQTKANQEITLEATYRSSDPSDPPAVASVRIYVLPGEPHHLDILDTPEVADVHNDASFSQLWFSKELNQTTIYAVVRDEYGNYIRDAINPIWESTNGDVVDVMSAGTNAALAIKQQELIGGDAWIIVREGNLIPDSVGVTSEGTKSSSASPIPFNPTIDVDFRDILKGAYNTYAPILEGHIRGTLVAINTDKPLQEKNGSYGNANIFDAVGNLVAPDVKVEKSAKLLTYGFVWEGKNQRNRNVGSGAYLIYVTGTYTDGSPYEDKLKVGVRR